MNIEERWLSSVDPESRAKAAWGLIMQHDKHMEDSGSQEHNERWMSIANALDNELQKLGYK